MSDVCDLSAPGSVLHQLLNTVLYNLVPNPYGIYKTLEFGFDEVSNVFKCGLSGFLKGCKNDYNVIAESFYDQIVAKSVFQVIQDCENSTAGGQYIVVNCDNPGSPPFEENPGCRACAVVRNTLYSNRRSLEARAYELDDGYRMQTLTGTAAAKWTDEANNPCHYACDSCVVQQVEQLQNLVVKERCRQQANWKEKVQQKLSANLSATLGQFQDVFGELGGMLSPQSVNCIVDDVALRISQRLTNKVLDDLLLQIQQVQKLEVLPGSHSIFVNKLKQSVNVNTVQSLVSQTNITNSLYSEAEIKEASNLISRNDSIGDLANSLEETAVELDKIFSSMIFKLLLIVGVVLFGGVIVLIVVMTMQHKQKWEYQLVRRRVA